MPNAVCCLLLESGVKDLGIHTEMMTDGLGLLYRSGRVTGSRKTLDPGKVTYTFALGSHSLYATANRNPDLYCHQVDYTNSPYIIMQNEKVVSINNTTQVDLQGQVASESDGQRHISGTGGQLQFVRGAYASKGGKSFICLSSTYEKRGERRSRIVFSLTPGNIVTTPRSDVMYVVTEFGMVNLKGRSVAERAKATDRTRASRFPRGSGTAGIRKPADSSRRFVFLTNGACHTITPGLCATRHVWSAAVLQAKNEVGENGLRTCIRPLIGG